MAVTNSTAEPQKGYGTELQTVLDWVMPDDPSLIGQSLRDIADEDWVRVEGYTELPEIGDESEVDDDTELWETARRASSKKLPALKDFEMSFKENNGDPIRVEISDRAYARGNIAFRIVYSTGTVETYAVAFRGRHREAVGLEEYVMFMVKGTRTGELITSRLPLATEPVE